MTVLKGVSTPNTALTAVINTGISSGVAYVFSYYGINSHGSGAESDPTTIYAATNPSQLLPPTVAYTASAYQVSWSLPSNLGGAVNVGIDSYLVEFKTAAGDWEEIVPECDGLTDGSIISARTCTIALSTFTSAPFSLAQGVLILARVSATNDQALTSVVSNPSSSNAYVVAKPHQPPSAPSRNVLLSTKTLLQVDMPSITGTLTGGLTITDY